MDIFLVDPISINSSGWLPTKRRRMERGNALTSGGSRGVGASQEYTNHNDMSTDLAAAPPAQQMERCGRWLLSIPRSDILALHQTPEYQEFLRAFERLGNVHRRDVARHGNFVSVQPGGVQTADGSLLDMSDSKIKSFSFLQHMAADDVVLKVLEFLECQSLVRMTCTCSRFRELARKSATQRTQDVANTRQLSNVMQLLRAKEQIDGVGTGIMDSHVRVPILLLSRRVIVSNSGDPELNGVYFCTGSNGNGFIFTKPRDPEQRVRRLDTSEHIVGQAPVLESEVAQPGQLLRCIIAKRFSNETILWYMSKEVIATEDTEGTRAGEVTQVFSFWAKLMVVGDASPDVCRYPSQTSILTRHQEGWQSLSTTQTVNPPLVELLD